MGFRAGWMAGVCALACLAAGAQAAEFSVGRSTVVLPGEGWRSFDMKDEGAKYRGGDYGSIRSETKVLVQESADKVAQAILVVRVNTAGMRDNRLVFRPNCQIGENGYAFGNTGVETNHLTCTRVVFRYATQSVINAITSGVWDTLGASGVVLPESVHSIASTYMLDNGTFAEVTAFFAPSFLGRPGKLEEAIPNGLNPGNVVWSKELAAALDSSVHSISGKLTIPSIEFAH